MDWKNVCAVLLHAADMVIQHYHVISFESLIFLHKYLTKCPKVKILIKHKKDKVTVTTFYY